MTVTIARTVLVISLEPTVDHTVGNRRIAITEVMVTEIETAVIATDPLTATTDPTVEVITGHQVEIATRMAGTTTEVVITAVINTITVVTITIVVIMLTAATATAEAITVTVQTSTGVTVTAKTDDIEHLTVLSVVVAQTTGTRLAMDTVVTGPTVVAETTTIRVTAQTVAVIHLTTLYP